MDSQKINRDDVKREIEIFVYAICLKENIKFLNPEIQNKIDELVDKIMIKKEVADDR